MAAILDDDIDPGWFIDGSDGVYLQGGTEAGNPAGVSFTYNQAIDWFKFVWTHNIGYHHVRPTLLPGAAVLTDAGRAFAVKFQEQDDLEEAPEDFNPLGLEVIA